MRRLFESKLTIATVLCLFALNFALTGHGSTIMPPDPWAGFAALGVPASSGIAHGPSLPPEPWAGFAALRVPASSGIAHGPSLPPEPWAG